MRLKDLTPLNEAKDKIPHSMKYTMPQSVIIPDMDLYYEFYKFVTNMACHPELENQMDGDNAMRDVPVAVAYTPQEHDMIMATAKRLGKHPKEIAFKGSKEQPGIHTSSPVMKFDMFESICERLPHVRSIQQQFKNLYEASAPALEPDIENTISPTMTMPSLINSDTYKQYRYAVALAAARAVAAGEVGFDAESAWNEALTGIAYSQEEIETFKLANKLMGIDGVMLSDSPSKEPDDTQPVSPVFKFNMFESTTEQMRKVIDELEQS